MTDIEAIPVGGATAGGLPYPTSTDQVCHTAQYIRQLSDAVDYRLANRGIIQKTVTVTANSNGDANIQFPELVVLWDAIIHPTNAGGWTGRYIWLQITGYVGTQVNFRCLMADAGSSGYSTRLFASASMTVAAFGFGQAK